MTQQIAEEEKDLTPEDIRDYDRLDNVVRAGKKAFLEVGSALLEIHDRRLYLFTHGSFEAYVESRLGKSRQWGYLQMNAARVSTAVDITSERQARVLSGLSPEAASKVMTRARANNNTTAPGLQDALVELVNEEEDAADKIVTPERQRRPKRDLANRMESWSNLGRMLIRRHYHDVSEQAEALLDALMKCLRGSSEV